MANKEIRTIGVLTSGGDAPGMNAAIRAVVRTALGKGLRVRGIRRGYQGLLEEEIIDLSARDVSDTIQRGGTFLQTAIGYVITNVSLYFTGIDFNDESLLKNALIGLAISAFSAGASAVMNLEKGDKNNG